MFDTNDERYLLKAISDNRVILFLGAGFSHDASNRLGNHIPSGMELADQIWNLLDYDDPYNGTDLGKLYANMLNSGKKKDVISSFLEDRLLCDSVPPNYDVLTKVYWRRIYTLNVDDLLEQTYKRNDSPKLDIITYPNDDPKERDQFLDRVQLVHLNGKLPCNPNDLTFSPSQHSKRMIFDTELYNEFVQEYAINPTIFIGTKLDEPLLYHCIQARKARGVGISEQRSKSFLISPNINEAEKDYLLHTFNIIAVKGKTNSFLEWLDENVGNFPDRLKILEKKAPYMVQALTAEPSMVKKSLIEFSKYFHRVPDSIPRGSSSSQFLQGTTPKWEDILLNLDAPREITDAIMRHIVQQLKETDEFSIVAILGYAGCGKSTILRRLGLTLSQAGEPVSLTNSEELPSLEVISDALESFEDRAVLLFDNAEAALGYLPSLSRCMSSHKKPPIIVIASRINDFDRRMGRFSGSLHITEMRVPNLTRNEMISIIKVLEDNSLLGKLQGMNDHQRIEAFENQAEKQILVAMRDATSGTGFDNIITDEFESLVPEEAHTLYLCAALATEAGFRLTEQELLGCSRLTPAETLHILRRNLNNIIVRSGSDDNLLMIRHRYIADYIVTSVASPNRLQIAYTQLLLAIQIGRRESKAEKLYRKLINHSIIYGRFENNLEEARKIYRSIQRKYNNNPHFWLQYGSLEMTYGSLNLAEAYLNSAESLDAHNNIIQNAIGHLKLKQSIDCSTKREALVLRDEGSTILRERFDWVFYSSSNQYDDPFPLHMYCSERLRWINKWKESDEEEKTELEHLRSIIDQGRKHFPINRQIRILKEEIERGYLSLAVK